MTTSVAVQESPSTAVVAPARTLSDQLTERGVTGPMWHVLTKSLYPGAKPESTLMVLDYCAARKLDPMKKPCHIVPMKVKQGDDYVWRDVVLPGIYEYRTTAMRTGLYLGHSKPEYGEVVEFAGVKAPEWCSMTFKRLATNGQTIEFPVTVYFREACNTKDEYAGSGSDRKKTGKVIANDRWAKAPIQMLTKCAEAAGLREAFPDEFGGEQTYDEMVGASGVEETPVVAQVKPAQRTSQQPPVEPPPTTAATIAEPEPEPERGTAPDAKANVGVIEDVVDKSQGGKLAAAVKLNTGFTAATRDAAFIAAATALRDRKAIVELVTTPSSDPKLYAPKLTEIVVVESGEAVS